MTEGIPAEGVPTQAANSASDERLLAENFALREKVRNLEEDIEALQWEIKLRRMRSPWRELPSLKRRILGRIRR